MNRFSDRPSECAEIRLHLDAHLDDEITDASLSQTLQEHLDSCSGCQLELDNLKALDRRLKDLPVMAVSERLRRCVETLARKSVKPHREGLGTTPMRRSVRITAMAATVPIILLVLGIWLWSAQGSRQETPLANRGNLIAFVDDYVAYGQSDSAPVEKTRDPARMEGWLAARLDFAPKLPRWPWAELISGRLCFIHERRVARVEYKAGETDLTLFIQPLTENAIEETGEMSSIKTQSLRGFEVACWRSSELDYVLVGPASATDLFSGLEIGRQEE